MTSIFARASTIMIALSICCLLEIGHFRCLEAATFQGLGIPVRQGSDGDLSISGNGKVVINSFFGSEEEPWRWTESSGLEFLGRSRFLRASGLSYDGSVIVGGAPRRGQNGTWPATWTEDSGWELLTSALNVTGGHAVDVSADGSVVVGNTNMGPFRWTEESGLTNIDLSFGADGYYTSSISADGSVIVGGESYGGTPPFPSSYPWLWSDSTGAVRLQDPKIEVLRGYESHLISADGDVVTGRVSHRVEGQVRTSIYYWTEQTGMTILEHPENITHINGEPRFDAQPSGISGDGSVIVGDPPYGAIIWDTECGMRYFEQELVSKYDLGFQLAGWEDVRPKDISDDGRTIVGAGVNPNGEREVWLVRLDSDAPPIPPIADVVEIHGTPVNSVGVQGTGELLSFVAGGIAYTQDDLIQPTLTKFAGNPTYTYVGVPTRTSVPDDGERGALLTEDFQLDSGIVNPTSGADVAALTFAEPLVNGPGPDLVVFEVARPVVDFPAEFVDPFQISINGVTGVVGASSWGPELGMVTADWYRRNGADPTTIEELENGDLLMGSTLVDTPYFGIAIDLSEFGVAPMGEVTTVEFGSIGTTRSFDPVLFMGINSAQFVPEPTSLLLATLALTSIFGSFPVRHTR